MNLSFYQKAYKKIQSDLAITKEEKDKFYEDGFIASEQALWLEAEMGKIINERDSRSYKQGTSGKMQGKGALPANIGKKESHEAQELHKNRDLIEETIEESASKKELPTKTNVLKKIKAQKQRENLKEKHNTLDMPGMPGSKFKGRKLCYKTVQ